MLAYSLIMSALFGAKTITILAAIGEKNAAMLPAAYSLYTLSWILKNI